MTSVNAVWVAQDESVSKLVRSAGERLVVLAPADSVHAAEVIAEHRTSLITRRITTDATQHTARK